MRYVSWFEGWFGSFFAGHHDDQRLTDPYEEDLFYLAMLGPHV
ncbi:hypothetical protein [Bradyrhizobium sp. HKCCYLS20291]